MQMEATVRERAAAEIRKIIISITDHVPGKVHWGSSLSCVEIMDAVCCRLQQETKDLRQINGQIIVSKGQAALALYSVLFYHGLIQDFRAQYQKDRSAYPEEITFNRELGIPCSTGSLGMGLPYAAGKALMDKRNGRSQPYYVIMGDGECDEGSVWETVMFAAHHGLDNLCVIVDRNRLQSDGETEAINRLDNLTAIFESFGWVAVHIDGHSPRQLDEALALCGQGKPVAVIAETIKGKGVSFMENDFTWHDRLLNGNLAAAAKKEVGLEDA